MVWAIISEGTNLSVLQAFNEEQTLPQIFEGDENSGTCMAIASATSLECNILLRQERTNISASPISPRLPSQLYCSVNYPRPKDVEDPDAARFVSLADMKHWELAPTNPGAFSMRHRTLGFRLRDPKQFLANYPASL